MIFLRFPNFLYFQHPTFPAHSGSTMVAENHNLPTLLRPLRTKLIKCHF